MIGSLFRIGLLATLVGGSTFALVGPDRIKLHFENGKASVLSAIDDAQAMETKLGLIRAQIGGLDKELKNLKEEAIRRSVEVERLRGDVAARESELTNKERVLEKVGQMLADGRDSYTIGSARFSRTAVEADAREKLALFQVQSDTMNTLRETLSTKENALALAEQNVGRAAALRVDLVGKVGLLEAQLQKFRARQSFAATSRGEFISTDEIDSDLAKAREMIAAFEEDLEVKSRLLEEHMRLDLDQPTEGIDYEATEQAADADDLVGQIDRALSRVRGDAMAQRTRGFGIDAPTVVH